MWRAMWRAMGVLWAFYGRAMWSLLEATTAAAAATTAAATVTAAAHDVDHRDAWLGTNLRHGAVNLNVRLALIEQLPHEILLCMGETRCHRCKSKPHLNWKKDVEPHTVKAQAALNLTGRMARPYLLTKQSPFR